MVSLHLPQGTALDDSSADEQVDEEEEDEALEAKHDKVHAVHVLMMFAGGDVLCVL